MALEADSSKGIHEVKPSGDCRQIRAEALGNALRLDAMLTQDYIFLLMTSCIIASFGLISNNAAGIIGAMIIAPMMLPIRAFAFAALRADLHACRSSAVTISMGVGIAVLVSWLIGMTVPASTVGSEIAARTQPNLLDLAIAIAAGAVSAYAKVRKQLSDAIVGTAISVALMPPVCVVGICLSKSLYAEAGGSFLLFMTNLLGIMLASMITFFIAGFIPDHRRSLPAFGVVAVLTTFLALPLGYSLWDLLRQARVEAALRHILVTRTVTLGKKSELTAVKMNWSRKIPIAYLFVRANEPPTPIQVALLEHFVERELGQRFTLIVEVSRLLEIRAPATEPPSVPAIGPSDVP